MHSLILFPLLIINSAQSVVRFSHLVIGSYGFLIGFLGSIKFAHFTSKYSHIIIGPGKLGINRWFEWKALGQIEGLVGFA